MKSSMLAELQLRIAFLSRAEMEVGTENVLLACKQAPRSVM